VIELTPGFTECDDRLVTDLAARYEKHGLLGLPVLALENASPAFLAKFKAARLHDWRNYKAAMETLSPLLEAVLSLMEGKPEAQELFESAFPRSEALLNRTD
jgi:hypothetical protein